MSVLICLLASLLWMTAGSAPADETLQRLTIDSPIDELLDNDAARAVLEREVPAITSSSQIRQATGIALSALKVYAPAILTDEKLKAIDEELARTPGAVTRPGDRHPVKVVADFQAPLQLEQIPLWEGRAPDAQGNSRNDIPTLTPIGTDGSVANGTAVIVAPGGGYQGLATGHEGRQVADWFAAHGVAAFVLSYRLVSFDYRHPVQLHDAQRAIRWVRAHADDHGIDPNRIGMIGFSAGGHLTAMASTLFDEGDPNARDPIDRVSSRPDFAILGYPAILVDESWRDWLGLIDRKANARTRRELIPSQNVQPTTPPTFIFHTTTDEVVAPANAIAYYEALVAAAVPAELHVFAEGRHGLGFAMSDPALGVWPSLLRNWMYQRGLLSPDKTAR